MAASLTTIFQVGADKTRRSASQDIEINISCQGFAAGHGYREWRGALARRDGPAPPAVETTGPEQGRIEDIGPVGGGNDDHAGVGVETIHLHQDLVQGLLALVVAAAQAGATMPAHRVDLVDKHDAGAVALGLLEQVAHAAGADAHEHLHEFGAGDGEEGHARFAGDGLGHERLAGAGVADHEHALGDAGAQRGELLRFVQEFDHLAQFFFGFVAAGDIVKGDGGFVAGDHLGFALAKTHGLVVRALRLAHEEEQECANENQRGDASE